VGFSLIADGQTEAENFCETLPLAFKEGEGGMEVVPAEHGKCKIIFTNEACFFRGKFEVTVSKEQGEAIKKLWKDPQKLGIYKDGVFTLGFKVVLISEANKKLVRTEIETNR
jgi:hypothetical protein